jgi:hypothetical protein
MKALGLAIAEVKRKVVMPARELKQRGRGPGVSSTSPQHNELVLTTGGLEDRRSVSDMYWSSTLLEP